jgi:Ubiquitin-conjugating enzyme
MVTRHQGPRREPSLLEPDIQTQVQVQSFIPYWYVLLLFLPATRSLFLPSHPTPSLTPPPSPRQLISHPEPPEVTFLLCPDRPIPMHPHIYSNGIICLDLLGQQGWSPVQNVESICMSLQSMLTGNTKNERPEGDQQFVANNRRRPRDIDFYYHDNTV